VRRGQADAGKRTRASCATTGEWAQVRRWASGTGVGRRALAAAAGELGGSRNGKRAARARADERWPRGRRARGRQRVRARLRPRAHLRRGGSLSPSQAPLVVRSLDGEFWSSHRRRTHDAPAPSSPCAAAWPPGSTSSRRLLRIWRREPPSALSPLPPCALHLLFPPSCWR
jgi:hypothetical protein